MKKSRLFMAIILAVLFMFTVSAVELDVAEEATAVLSSENYGSLVFSADFEGITSIKSGDVVAKMSADFGGGNVVIYHGGLDMVYGLATPISGGSQMLSMAANGYHGGARFQGFTLNRPGTYTLTYDRYYTKTVAYQSYGIGVAPSTATSAHTANPKETIKAVFVLNEGETFSSYINIQFAKYQAGLTDCPVYIDNVNLYYMGGDKSTAKILYGDSESKVYKTIENVMQGSVISLPSTTDFEEFIPDGMFLKHFAIGNNTAAPGSDYVVSVADAESGTFLIYPVFANVPDEGFGELVYIEDFENITGSISNGTYLPNSFMGTFSGKKVQITDGGTGSTYTVDSPLSDGTKMLGIGSTGNYTEVRIPNLNLSKEGIYTLKYDYYIPLGLTLWFFKTELSTERTPGYINGSLRTITEAFEIEAGSGDTIPKIMIQIGRTPTTTKCYIDNIRVYYDDKKPVVDYGVLIDTKNYETDSSINESLGTTGSGLYNFGTGATFGVGLPTEVPSITNMLKVTTTTQTTASAGYTNMEITRAGTYSLVFDCFVPENYPLGRFDICTNLDDVKIDIEKGKKAKYAAQIEVAEGEKLTQIFFRTYNFGSAINGTFYIDNVKFYFKSSNPDDYNFSDYATNLVSTFIGDAKTSRGFAWTADFSFKDMAVRYAEKATGLENDYTEIVATKEAHDGRLYYKVDVTGLKAGTEYVYIVGDKTKNIWSDEFVFETEPEEISSYKVLAFADPQVANTNVAAVWYSNAEKAFSDVTDAKFSLGLGDLVNEGYDEKQWEMYFNGFKGICATIPNMSVLGNHESRAGIAGKNFQLHFNNPDNGHEALFECTSSDVAETYTKELIENFKESVYSFDYGDAHFVALNTGSDWAASTDGIKLVKAQLAWLENDLYNSDAKWNIVMVHRPVYDCFDPESESSLATILDGVLSEYGVDLVLQGHEHYIARTYPIKNKEAIITADADTVEKGAGVVYFTAGRASNLSSGTPSDAFEHIAKVANTAGDNPTYTVLEVSEDSIKVVTKTLKGEIADSFEIVDNTTETEDNAVTGELLVDEDFEDVASNTVIFNDTSAGGTLSVVYKNSYISATNPETASIYSDKLFSITRGGETNTSYSEKLGGNMAIRVESKTNGGSANPQIGLYGESSNANKSLGLSKPGKYIVSADFYLPAKFANKVNYFMIQSSAGSVIESKVNVDRTAKAGRWYNVKSEITLDGTNTLEFCRFVANLSDVNAGVHFYVDNIKLYCEPVKPYLHATAESITEDSGTITITPYNSKDDLTVISGVHYTTDSACATLTRNEDGTATIVGKLNGKVTVTAIFDNPETPKASIEIDISGQSDRVASTSLKVLMLGNSILNHGPNPSLGWGGNWGMAASSEDKDYAHRLTYFIDQKYGSGTAELVKVWMADLETKWSSAEAGHDFTAEMANYVEKVAEAQPDIITLQCGENVGTITAENYYNATRQFIAAFKEVAPDAIIVVCTPFWGGNSKIEGMAATANEFGLPLAELHVLNNDENKAFEFYTGGVGNHPGDKGMNNIAKIIFEKLNVVLSEDSPVEYTAQPESVTITGESTISEDCGSITLTAEILPNDAAEEVYWSVDDENIAVVDSNGVVTAIANGTVTVKAVSRYNEEVFATHTVTISGQSDPFDVVFKKNADDEVTDIPDTLKRKGTVSLEGYYPYREGYSFVGWTTVPNGAVVETVEVTSDITLYAKWRTADRFDFNRDGYAENFSIDNGFNVYVIDGVYHAIATDTDAASDFVLTVKSPKLALDSADYKDLVIRMQNSDFDSNTAINLEVKTTSGTYNYSKPVTSAEYTEYVFDLSNAEGIITEFSFVPVNKDCTVRIDEIYFIKADNLPEKELRCKDGYVSLVCEIDNTGYTGTTAVIAYYEGAKIVKTEIKVLEDNALNTVNSYFATDKNIDKAQIFVLDSLKPIKESITINKN